MKYKFTKYQMKEWEEQYAIFSKSMRFKNYESKYTSQLFQFFRYAGNKYFASSPAQCMSTQP